MQYPLASPLRDRTDKATHLAWPRAILLCLLAMLFWVDAGAQGSATNSAPFAVVSSKHRREIADTVVASRLMCKSTRENVATFMDLVQNFDLIGSSALDGSMSSTTFRGRRAGREVTVKFFVNSGTNLLSSVWVDGDLVLGCDADGRVEDFRAQPSPMTIRNEGSAAPSFDCSRATSRTEHLICGDEQLASMDRELAALQRKALGKVAHKAAFRRESAEHWKTRETTCASKACLVDWFTQRLERLRLIAGH